MAANRALDDALAAVAASGAFVAEVDQAIAEAFDPNTQWVSNEDATARLDAVLAKQRLAALGGTCRTWRTCRGA